jgi:crossover junction endodeoxyribonuclease RuvC
MVLGIDPGLAVTGYGLVRLDRGRPILVEAGVLRTRPAWATPRRLQALGAGLEALLDRHSPTTVAIEGQFADRNVRSALVLAQVRGAIMLTLARRDLLPAEYSPMEVKKAITGYGRAEKEQVRAMVLRLLGAPPLAAPLDASDALAIAICHAHSTRTPGLTATPGGS